MRLLLLPLIALTLVPALAQKADPTLPPQTHPPLEPPIRRVRLHPDEAWITRVGLLPGLGQGYHRIQLTGLPAGLKLEDVRITARGPAGTRLGELTVKQEAEPFRDLPIWKQLGKDLEKLEEELHLLTLQEQSHAQAEELFNQLSESQQREIRRRLGGEGVKPQVLIDLSLAVETRTLELERAKYLLVRDREALQRKKADLEASRFKVQAEASARPVRVMVDLEMPRGGDAELDLSYRSQAASWAPAYEARLGADRTRLELVLLAAVKQGTEEDWRGVTMELANQRASSQLGLPPSPGLRPLTYLEGEPPKTRQVAEAGPATTQAPVTFQLPGTVDVPRQEEQRFRVTSLDLSPTFHYLAMPRQTTAVFLLALVSPPPAFPLMAGSPLNLMQGHERLGTLILEPPAPGEPLRLSFGAVPGLTATRIVVGKGFREVGDKAKEREWTFQERLNVASTLPTPSVVEILDRQVASATESVRVEDLEGTTPDWTEPQPGLRSWTLTVGPNTQGEVNLRTRIQGPLVGRLLNVGDLVLEGNN